MAEMNPGMSLLDRMERAAKNWLEEFARDVIVRDAIALAPTGDPREDPDPADNIRDQFHVHEAKQTPTGIIVEIENDSDHALFQHEAYWEHPRGGQRKFLETAVKRNARRVQPGLAEAVRRAT